MRTEVVAIGASARGCMPSSTSSGSASVRWPASPDSVRWASCCRATSTTAPPDFVGSDREIGEWVNRAVHENAMAKAPTISAIPPERRPAGMTCPTCDGARDEEPAFRSSAR